MASTPVVSQPPYRSSVARLLVRNKIWLVLASLPFPLAAAVLGRFFSSAETNLMLLLPALYLMLAGFVFHWMALKLNPHPGHRAGELRVDSEGVWFDDKLLVARERISQGIVMPYRGETVVRLSLKGSLAVRYLSVPDVEAGRALLVALGLDATQTAATFNVASAIFALPKTTQILLMLSPIGIGLFTSMYGIGPLGFIPAQISVLVLLMMRTKLHIGADGLFTRWGSTQKYYPFSRVAGVSAYEARRFNKTVVGIQLSLKSGEVIRLPVGQAKYDRETVSAVIERISEAIEAYETGLGVGDSVLLERNGRRSDAWVHALRSIGAGSQVDMRTPPVSHERLWTAVEDPAASPVVRASAAIALSENVSPADRRRIRIAADTTASPKLRIALERASDREISEEALAESLAELEQEQLTSRVR